MTNYVVNAKDGVKYFGTGQSWGKGQAIGPAGLPPQLWESLLADGSVVEVVEVEDEPEPIEVVSPSVTLADIAPDWLDELAALSIYTVEDLQAVDDATLTSISGVGPATVAKWREAAQ